MASLALLAATIICVVISSCMADQGFSVKLPKPSLKGMSVEEAITQRRSIRSYSSDDLSLEELSQILFAAQGITARSTDIELRAAPSAGATYPIEIYVFVNRVSGLDPGIYHYVPSAHAIELAKSGDYGRKLSDACLKQRMPQTGACSIVMTAVPERTTRRYGDRAMRYIYMEAGHISENIYLQCTSLGLGTVCIGAFSDEKLDQLIGIDGKQEMSILVNSIGRLSRQRGEED